MAMRVVKELAVVVSTYEDRQSGTTKNRYENVGVLMEGTNDRGEVNQFLMFKRSFNPAGVPFKPGSDKILISMFDPKPGDGQSGQRGGGQATQTQSQGSDQSYGQRGSAIDDEIPF